MSADGKSGVAAVERAIRLLEAVARADTPPTMQSLANTVGCAPSTAHRIVVTLTQGGLLQFDPRTKRYSLGAGLARLAQRRAAQFDVAALAQPAMDRLRDGCGETVSLWARSNGVEVCLAVADGRYEIRQSVTVGATATLAFSAGSLVLMADQSRKAVLQWARDALGEGGRALVPDIADDVAAVRSAGVVILGGDHPDRVNPDVATLGSPVYGPDGEVAAALVIAGPAGRFAQERIAAMARDLRESALEVTSAIGGRVGARAGD